jgi:tetratricopeptide (TPR) repeat protein
VAAYAQGDCIAMPKTRVVLAILLAGLIVCGGCGRRKPPDVGVRLEADVTRYGLPEVVARSRQEVQDRPTAESYDYLARAYAVAKQMKPARQALEKAVSLDPAYPSSAVMLARVLMQENRTADAERMMRTVLAKHPDSSEAAEVLCRALLKQSRGAESEQVAQEALKHNGNEPLLLWARADTYAVLKRAAEAEKDYLRAIALAPKNIPLRMAYVQALVSLDKKAEAARAAQETVQLSPNAAAVRFMAASTLHQAGQMEEALAQYKEALIIDPGMVAAANNLALLLADRRQDTSTAVAWARKASRLAPRSLAVGDTLGWALVRDGQYEEGIQVLQAVARGWGNNPSVCYHLGWAYASTGQKAAGRKLLQQAAAAKADVSADALKALRESS